MSRGRSKKLPLLELLQKRFPNITKKDLYARILCREVRVDGGITGDPKALFSVDCRIELVTDKYVGRGGEKLESAYTAWRFPVDGMIFIDAGASTGGFTHFLLQHGAACVHSVDVGYNQLDYRLRTDPRVIVRERTNVMSLEQLTPRPDAAVGDLSFRSLRGAVRHVLSLTVEGWGVFLLKPQFEILRPGDEFDGVLSDSRDQRTAVEETLLALADEGIRTQKILPSGIRGRKGNQEYLVLVRLDAEELHVRRKEAAALTEELFRNLANQNETQRS